MIKLYENVLLPSSVRPGGEFGGCWSAGSKRTRLLRFASVPKAVWSPCVFTTSYIVAVPPTLYVTADW